jgi:serine/threonine-protein kinase
VSEKPLKRVSKYELWELIGQGAMGAVYRAYDPILGRTIAVKLMGPSIARDKHLQARFHREARAAGSLQHPNIITVYDFGESNNHLFIAMEYVAGTDLSTMIAEHAPLSIREKLDITLGVLGGLSYAHAQGIVHRDIKPGNIRITNDGQVKIMDFGVAHLADTDLTSDGIILGTPCYMAPEQLRGQKLGAVTDIFALGAVLYELLTLRKPFTGDTTHAVLYSVINEEPPPVVELNPTTPPAIRQIVSKAMAKDPKQRYPSAHAMTKDVRAARLALEATGEMPTVFMSTRELPLGMRLKTMALRPRGLAGMGAIGLMASAAALWGLSGARGGGTDAADAQVLDRQRSTSSVASAASQDPLADTLVTVRAAALTHRALTQSAGVPESLLAIGDSLATVADSLAEEGRFSQAIIAFSTARSHWAAAEDAHELRQAEAEQARQLAARRRSASRRRSTPPPSRATQPAPSRPTATAAARFGSQDRARIESMVEQLSRAVSSENVEQIRRIYPSLSGEEQQSWERFFRSARNLSLTLAVQRLDGRGDSAQADLTGTFKYEQRTSGRRREAPAHFLTTFVRKSGAWTLVSIRAPSDSSNTGDRSGDGG